MQLSSKLTYLGFDVGVLVVTRVSKFELWSLLGEHLLLNLRVELLWDLQGVFLGRPVWLGFGVLCFDIKQSFEWRLVLPLGGVDGVHQGYLLGVEVNS